MILLKRVDAERHVDRWYLIAVGRDLFGPALICGWGNRRTKFQHLRATSIADEQQALALVNKLVARRLRRGYAVVDDQSSDSGTSLVIDTSL